MQLSLKPATGQKVMREPMMSSQNGGTLYRRAPKPEPAPEPELEIILSEPIPHANNPDGLPARDLVNERNYDSMVEETKLDDGTIQGTYTTGMTPMPVSYTHLTLPTKA